MNTDLRGNYKLEHKTYIETKRLIRSFPKLVDEYNSILHATPTPDGMPRGNQTSDVTGNMVVRLLELSIKIDAIYKALLMLPKYYQTPVFEHIVYRKANEIFASESTMRRWQYKYVYYVHNLVEEKKDLI